MHVMPDFGLRPTVAEVVCPLSPCLSYTRRNSTTTSSSSPSSNSRVQAFPTKSHSVKYNESRTGKGSRRFNFTFDVTIKFLSPRFLGIRLFRLSKRSLRHFFHRKEFRRKGNESTRTSPTMTRGEYRRDAALLTRRHTNRMR